MKQTIYFCTLFTLLVFSVSPQCLDPQQQEGACSDCQRTYILLEGHCLQPIRGCFSYLVPRECIECQFGFVLDSGECIREAEFFNRTEDFVPPVVINETPSLSQNDIIRRVGLTQVEEFNKVLQHFRSTYSEELRAAGETISSVEAVMSANGNIYSIDFGTTSTGIYETEARFNLQGNVEQLYFGRLSTDAASNLHSISETIDRFQSSAQLLDRKLYSVQTQSTNFIRLTYLDPVGRASQAFLQRNPYMLIEPLGEVPQVVNKQYILRFVYFTHPSLRFEENYSVRIQDDGNTQICTFNFTSDSEVEVENTNNELTITRFDGVEPAVIPPEENQNTFTETEPVAMGNYVQVTDLRDPGVNAAFDFLLAEHPQLESIPLQSALEQTLSGTKHRLTFSNGVDSYQASTLTTSEGEIILLNLLRNSVSILRNSEGEIVPELPLPNVDRIIEDINSDPELIQAIIAMRTQLRLVNPSAIERVERRQGNNEITYTLIFSEDQTAQIRVQTDRRENRYQTLNYIIDGVDLVQLRGANQRTMQEIINFIKNQNTITGKYLIQSYTQRRNLYEVVLLTNRGVETYEITETQNGIAQTLSQVDVVQHCAEIPIELNAQIEMLLSSIRRSYAQQIEGFEHTLTQAEIQTAILGDIVTYRLLFTSPRSKQIEFKMSDSLMGVSIDTVKILNRGYETIDQHEEVYVQANEQALQNYSKYLDGLQLKYGESNEDTTNLYYAGILDNASGEPEEVVLKYIREKDSDRLGYFSREAPSTQCQDLNSDGVCQSCSEETIAFYSNCLPRIEGCSLQEGRNCLLCERDWVKVFNASERVTQCSRSCSTLL